MVVAYHLGGLLGAWVGIAGSVGIMAQSEVSGISGFLSYFRVFIALTHEWTDFVRRLVAVSSDGPSTPKRLSARGKERRRSIPSQRFKRQHGGRNAEGPFYHKDSNARVCRHRWQNFDTSNFFRH